MQKKNVIVLKFKANVIQRLSNDSKLILFCSVYSQQLGSVKTSLIYVIKTAIKS